MLNAENTEQIFLKNRALVFAQISHERHIRYTHTHTTCNNC